MNYIQAVLYGFLSGFSEFTPVSSSAHQNLLLYIFGSSEDISLITLFTRLGFFLAILLSSRSLIAKMQRDRTILYRAKKRKRFHEIPSGVFDYRFIKTAAVPMAVLLFFTSMTIHASIISTVVLLVVSGIFLYTTSLVPYGDKDARAMTALDAIVLGVLAGFSAIQGISRIGIILCYCLFRGCDRQNAYKWGLLLSIPALFILSGSDLLSLIRAGSIGAQFLKALAAMTASLCGGYLGISFMKFILVNNNLTGFAFYSWGLSLFTFLIYILT